jgi:predicted small lipoprotein YifL
MKPVFLLFGLALLAGCGLRQPLEPPPGGSPPPAPAMANRPLTTEQMLTPPPIARPERMGEPLTRSEPRRGDRFDLPPADVPAGEDPTDPDEDEENPPE